MASAAAKLPVSTLSFDNVAELQDYLGGIPAHRIRLRPLPGQATEKDVLAILAREGRVCELVDGILVEKAKGFFESTLAAMLIHFIHQYLDEHDLGLVGAGDGFLRLSSRSVRAPDVSFLSWKSMPGGELPASPIPRLAPDLAVEILSQGNTPAEMADKLKEYFKAGTRLVWIVDPQTRTVLVYTTPRKPVLRTEEDTLDGGKVLPGFQLSIKEWFRRASRKPRRKS